MAFLNLYSYLIYCKNDEKGKHDEDVSVHPSTYFICTTAGRISVTSGVQRGFPEHYWKTLICVHVCKLQALLLDLSFSGG
jgi:hypothetical protein